VAANVAALYWVNYSGRFKHLTFERSCQSVMSVRQSTIPALLHTQKPKKNRTNRRAFCPRGWMTS